MPETSSNEVLIRLRGVTKSYPQQGRSTAILSDLDLDVHKGEAVVLLGRSGSGKSTLLNLIAGIDVANRGEIEVAGHRLDKLTEDSRAAFRRKNLGYVFQFFNLIPTLSALENIQLSLELVGHAKAQSSSRAEELLSAVGLADRARAWPEDLSGGEQQRIAIASALAHSPPLIVADEPTGNLDLETGQKIITLLDDLVRTEGCTLVMATHSRDVMGIADRVYHVDHGRLSTPQDSPRS